tara:strand:- start:279 stop:584 length:306 start_codon:yes stop_codon:yes gene_type:complete
MAIRLQNILIGKLKTINNMGPQHKWNVEQMLKKAHEKKEYSSALPKNSINTPLNPSIEELLPKLDHYREENERLRNNNENYKLDLIEARQKLHNILEIINK